jgi:hypothetical protein
MHLSSLPYVPHAPPISLLWSGHRNIRWGVQSRELLLGPEQPQSMFFPQSLPCTTRGKITILYVFIANSLVTVVSEWPWPLQTPQVSLFIA